MTQEDNVMKVVESNLKGSNEIKSLSKKCSANTKLKKKEASKIK